MGGGHAARSDIGPFLQHLLIWYGMICSARRSVAPPSMPMLPGGSDDDTALKIDVVSY